MRLPWPFRRNQRWIRQIDAYVDDRLTPIERELFEDRVDESEAVRKELDKTWALKSELGRLPEHPAPRSFAITPAMLRETEPAPRPRAAVATMRLAQGTAFAAVAAFALTIGLHASGWGTTDPDYAVVPASALVDEDGEFFGAEEAEPMAGDAAPPGTADLARGDDRLGDATDSEPRALPGTDAGERAGDDADVAIVLTSPAQSPNFIPVYGALGAVVILAGGAWLITRRQLSQRSP